MKHLRYNMQVRETPNEHPQKVLKSLGITYEDAIPQTVGDQWWFLNCKNVPAELPGYLSLMDVSLATCRQYELSESFAKQEEGR